MEMAGLISCSARSPHSLVFGMLQHDECAGRNELIARSPGHVTFRGRLSTPYVMTSGCAGVGDASKEKMNSVSFSSKLFIVLRWLS
jgi:hypothetical protein